MRPVSKRLRVHGVKTVEAFVEAVCAAVDLGPEPLPTRLSDLEARLEARAVPITIVWSGWREAARERVRRSSIPPGELPAGGSNMLREWVLELLYEEVSLLDKVREHVERSRWITLELDPGG